MCVTSPFSLNNQKQGMIMKDYKVKYEPKSLADMVIHDPNNEIMPLMRKYVSGEINQNRTFVGGTGTGKSTLAKVLTAEFYRSKGEEDTTQYVEMAYEKDDRNYGPNKTNFRWSGVCWHIFDEVDKCNHKNLYNVLHHTLNNQHGHKYLLTANSIVEMPKTIQSRAKPIFIDCPTPAEFFPRAKFILEQEKIEVDDVKIMRVLTACQRDLRDYYDALELL